MASPVLNFNVGILGHIDCGKTSLTKILSTVGSTAAFDKNPQSQERGITIDLGFSSFNVPIPAHIKSKEGKYETLQFTLVDCPGHASLMKTIIGGAQIIDIMILVIDITKGMQTQTAECLILGEITCNHMIVVLNKVDLIQTEKRKSIIEKMSKKILKTLEKTKFYNSPVVAISASPKDSETFGIDKLIEIMVKHAYLPNRTADGPFVFAVDHCFSIKGQGTVMTGTVIQGSIAVSDMIDIPAEKTTKKVKSIQMFKKPVQSALQGDRIGICVTQFDPKLFERGIACAPGHMTIIDCVIATVKKIPYFKGKYATKSKFHISIMHDTVIGKCSFFCGSNLNSKENGFDYDHEYLYLDELHEDLEVGTKEFVLLQFDSPVILGFNNIYIASKLEVDIHTNSCRLAFHGNILDTGSNKQNCNIMSKLKVYKDKIKEGVVDRIVNEQQVIGRDMFKKESNIQLFVNLKVKLSTGEEGFIEGTFGQSGKVNIRVPNGLSESTISSLKIMKKKKGDTCISENKVIKITLKFKKFMYGNKKQIFQSA